MENWGCFWLVNRSFSELFCCSLIVVSTGMITGAFGAHGLRQRAGTTPDNIHAWETASSYAVYNGLAMLLLSLHPRFSAHRFAGPAIIGGGLVFSGSIWCLVLAHERLRMLGPATPLGGMVMIAG
ncbi:hypothetical protein HYPSUDRAFT_127862 [Hypholoma sublateritium FD-334 SS-4]|uniref:DUF423-domain-containing protein n=1 Tax=Hypholoma sublateritium (strain FD-334 SS-4) TaxID=945553 RepID=A0A0D2PL99_HYPSF|nr:hypothetical protein HYPSUDRAFT_127862 [Hypholoma sublateritium FD-334 SS-4]